MAVESNEFATEPVPDAHTVAWPRVALVAAMVAFSLPTFLTGVEVAIVSRFDLTADILLAGALILTFIGCITGGIGASTRLSSYMLNRVAFGANGAALVNLAFALSLLGWFGVNIDLFSDAVQRLLVELFDNEIPAWPVELFAGLVMTVTTIFGFRAINILSTLLVPVLVMVAVQLIVGSLGYSSDEAVWERAAADQISFGDGVSAVVGALIVGAVILPDITRFIRHWRGALYTVVITYFVINLVVTGAGAMAATALFDGDLLSIMITLGIGWAAFAIVIFGSWVLNSLNLYSTMLSVESTVPDLNYRLLILVTGVLGTMAAFLNVLDYFLDFLFYLSIVFVPVSGVIAVDYLILRREAYYDLRKPGEVTIRKSAVAAWTLGAMVALAGSRGWLMLSGIAAVDAMLVAGGSYYLIARLVGTGRFGATGEGLGKE